VDLKEYRQKRRFGETPEPAGGVSAPAPAGARFVVQEHHARSVHWDLRLEMEGALRSWAVPKGPSLDPADKRLAVLVEDHPIEYGEFEGVIPPGNYGAGTVMLWDRGTYTCREGDPAGAFRAGKLTLDCVGEKLRGEFHFVRTKRNAGRDWLLFKGKDGFAVSGYSPAGTRSVKTGRTIEEIAADAGERWLSAPPDTKSRPGSARRGRRRTRASGGDSRASADPFPEPFRPMLAQSAARPFSRPGWLFEVKWDGVRALAHVRRRGAVQEIVLYSRTVRRLNPQFPEIVDALSRLDAGQAVLDGEVIAPDDDGRSSFARLQQRLHLDPASASADAARRIPLVYAVFDCLYLDGRDLRARPLAERRRVLDALALPAGVIRTDVVEGDGQALFDAARAHGLEGIVAKRATSPYRSGVRSPDWQKVKARATLEAVVGGFTRGKGHRAHTFGALVLGQYDRRTGTLVHVGQVGGGLRDADVRELRRLLEPLVTKLSPFASPPRPPAPPTWVRPELVVEVEHGGRTPDGMLRFPVFVRVRNDVRARDVLTSQDGDTAADVAAASGRPAPGADAPVLPKARGRRAGRPAGVAEAASPPGLAFTNLAKVFFPELGLTKRDVVEYYRRVAPYLLPYLRDRPLSLRRFPNGIAGNDFFQKDVPDAPPFVRTARIWSDQGDRNIVAVVGADEATLLWLAQLGCIETHAWFSRTAPVPWRGASRPATTFAGSERTIAHSVLNYPDFVVFDLDPFIYPRGKGPEQRHGELDPDYTRAGFERAREAALWVGDVLEALGLRSFVKTSGKTGLHVFVPIVRRYTYAQTHAFAKTMATWLLERHPDRLTTAWAVRDRIGKVFVDYNQNVRGKTLASAYSLRPVPQATVSVPVTWAELRAGLDPLQWTAATVFDRLARVGDPWAGILTAPQRLDVHAQARASGEKRRQRRSAPPPPHRRADVCPRGPTSG